MVNYCFCLALFIMGVVLNEYILIIAASIFAVGGAISVGCFNIRAAIEKIIMKK